MAVNISISEKNLKAMIALLTERSAKLNVQITDLLNEKEEVDLLLKELLPSSYSTSNKVQQLDDNYTASSGWSITELLNIIDRTKGQLAAKNAEELKPTINGFNKDWTWEAKIRFILKEKGEAMSTADVVKRLMEIEPYLTDRSSLISSISATFSIKSKPGGPFILAGKNHRNEAIYEMRQFALDIDDDDDNDEDYEEA